MEVPKDLPVLQYGLRNSEHVKAVQHILMSQGYFVGEPKGNFLRLTQDAVRLFQMAHLGPTGAWLDVDGVVGPDTWWALYNPSGKPQKSGIKAPIPSGLPQYRQDLLEVAYKEHAIGTKEIPDGSNWGDGVTKFLEGVGPAPWCCFFATWVHNEVFDKNIYGYRHGHVKTLWEHARDKHEGHTKYKTRGYTPLPGDLFVMLYRNSSGTLTGSGHIGFVLRTSATGDLFNTVEGNCGNRVKQGLRNREQDTLIGFINLFDDVGEFECETGIIKGSAVGSDGTR